MESVNIWIGSNGEDRKKALRRTELVGLPHRVDELSRSLPRVDGRGEVGSGSVESTSESVTDSEETGGDWKRQTSRERQIQVSEGEGLQMQREE
jgi:hypothetical protein